jgi:hypothetical protein
MAPWTESCRLRQWMQSTCGGRAPTGLWEIERVWSVGRRVLTDSRHSLCSHCSQAFACIRPLGRRLAYALSPAFACMRPIGQLLA